MDTLGNMVLSSSEEPLSFAVLWVVGPVDVSFRLNVLLV